MSDYLNKQSSPIGSGNLAEQSVVYFRKKYDANSQQGDDPAFAIPFHSQTLLFGELDLVIGEEGNGEVIKPLKIFARLNSAGAFDQDVQDPLSIEFDGPGSYSDNWELALIAAGANTFDYALTLSNTATPPVDIILTGVFRYSSLPLTGM